MLFPPRIASFGAVLAFLDGCGYVDPYEKSVHDMDPVYCYQSLAGIECYKEPNHQDKRRLVNYYGPNPTRYDAPDKPDEPAPQTPDAIDHWVKDPEPVPRPKSDLRASEESRPAPRQLSMSGPDAEDATTSFSEPQRPVRLIKKRGTLVLDGNKARIGPFN